MMNTHRTSAVPSSAQPKRRRQEARAQEPTWHSPYRLNEGKGRGRRTRLRGNHKPAGRMMGIKVGVTQIPPCCCFWTILQMGLHPRLQFPYL